MDTQRETHLHTRGAAADEQLTTFIVPADADLVVGAISASRFYTVELVAGASCCDFATKGRPVLAAQTAA